MMMIVLLLRLTIDVRSSPGDGSPGLPVKEVVVVVSFIVLSSDTTAGIVIISLQLLSVWCVIISDNIIKGKLIVVGLHHDCLFIFSV